MKIPPAIGPRLKILCFLAALSGLVTEPAFSQTYQAPVNRWKAQDALDAPPSGAILFLGSSSIRRWEDLCRDFADYKVIQRGIGGAVMADMIYHANEIVLPYNPRAIVMWAGTNDINAGATGQSVLNGFQTFVNTVHTAQPTVDIFFIGITKNPANSGNAPQTIQRLAANSLISSHIASSGNPRLHYIDLPASFENLDSTQMSAFYVDSLHMNRHGYSTIWSPVIRSALSAIIAPNRTFVANDMTPRPGRTLLFDFGPGDTTNGNRTIGTDSNGNVWNNWFSVSGGAPINVGEHIGNLSDATGAATGIDLTVTGGFSTNGRLNGGLLSPSASLLGLMGIGTVTEDYFYSTADGLTGGGDDDTPGSFMLEGLDPNLLYDFKFFGSRTVTDTRETTYDVRGANSGSATLRTSGNNIGSNGTYDGNDNKVAVVRGIRPNAFGEAFVDLTAAQVTNSNAYINAMEVTVISAFEGWTRNRGLTPGTNDQLAASPGADGQTNLGHFAMDTDPLGGGGSEGKQQAGLIDDSGRNYLTFTFPVRKGAAFSGNPLASAPIDGIVYTVYGDDNLQGTDLSVVEIPAGDTSMMPALGDYDDDGQADYEYRSFRLGQSTDSLQRGFVWVGMSAR